jgi:hypothetical protein
MLVSCSAYSATLKMEAICCSEMLVDIQWTTWHYIVENSILHNHCCENLKFYIVFSTSCIRHHKIENNITVLNICGALVRSPLGCDAMYEGYF